MPSAILAGMTATSFRIWALCGVLLTLGACAGGELTDDSLDAPEFEQIFVSKNDISRSAVNLDVQAIEMRPGESVADALRRAGLESGSFAQVVDEARSAGPNAPEAAPELPEPEQPDPEQPAEPDPEQPAVPDPEGPACSDSCQYANDGTCDDGSDPNEDIYCDRGTDCTDCAGQPAPEQPAPEQPEPAPEQPAPEQPEPAPEQPAPQGDRCSDTCIYAVDGTCDDGRPGAPYAVCAPGTDCTDCDGAGQAPAPPPEAPEDASPDAGGQICVANGRDGVCGPAAQCNGTPVAGFCPGAANIQCCVPGAAPAPNAPEPEAAEPAQTCRANGQDGTCMSTGSCGGSSVAGLCRGPADIQCCVDAPPAPPANAGLPGEGQACLASGRPGVCENIATCEGSSYPGQCAGNDSIKCCVPDALENKIAPLVYGAGLLIVRGVLFFATRSAAPVARQAVVGVMRQMPGQSQVMMGAANTAIAAAGVTLVEDQTQVLSGTAGAITEGWRQGLAQSRPAEDDAEENAPAVPDTLPQTNICAGQGTSLDACVLRRRAELGNATAGSDQYSCGDNRYNDLLANQSDACGLALRCQRAGNDVQRAARNWSAGSALPDEQALLVEFCRSNQTLNANRVGCIAARQQLIDECFPGELGDDRHRCEVCMQMSQRDRCQTEQFENFGCDVLLSAFGL